EGLADVRVKEADAIAIEKKGLAEARVVKERMLAEAAGDEQKGMAQVKVQQAEAEAIQLRGQAEAVAIQEKMQAEAKGLAEKASAMKALDGVGREHEEFRLKLQKEKEVELEALHIRRDIAASQAKVMAETMGSAKINIVGGDGKFFERFMNAVTLGQSVDGAFDNSESLKKLFGEYLNGNANLPADLKEILSRPGVTADVQNVALATLLAKLASQPNSPLAAQLKAAVDG
ncbi:MAG: hypothetical protein WBV82_05840, partial [Myxococcaceae bacterium]